MPGGDWKSVAIVLHLMGRGTLREWHARLPEQPGWGSVQFPPFGGQQGGGEAAALRFDDRGADVEFAVGEGAVFDVAQEHGLFGEIGAVDGDVSADFQREIRLAKPMPWSVVSYGRDAEAGGFPA